MKNEIVLCQHYEDNWCKLIIIVPDFMSDITLFQYGDFIGYVISIYDKINKLC